MNKMKEYKVNKNTFIGGWFISKQICKKIINFYNSNKVLQTRDVMDFSKKESSEIVLSNINFNNIFPEYLQELSMVLQNYKKKFIYSDTGINNYGIFLNIKIQHYKKNQGFKTWHCENNGTNEYRKRHLVFMTYLNTVKNAGTDFLYQNLTTKATQGLTLIWPAGWTHTHKGQISKTDEKYIVTGWYSFNE